jgi:tripartite-type tricarboxylate transporter receptor subunit TctC
MFTERRFALLAQTPTAAEQGFRGVVLSSMRALWVPDGVSESVFDALQTAVTATLRTEIHRQQMHAAGLEVQILNAAEYKNELARQSAAYRRLVPGLQWAAA